ncbi:RNA polymerase sigma factor, sigma-70 family [Dyadobacter koreensis]|uniref:RNA polymerase sigma factor, sigma-70 family n=1 Tax=Dyadobacter koreensis TaxID=408657 RepID=A0A1H6UTV0_9BACT|nr:sigma-70 family RNA polymerase sigma factor [Dyadobacter koreensis]SEI95769.1 RNA polymerase sigma factor, sigma-70 family [Dyadobacter koreensis]
MNNAVDISSNSSDINVGLWLKFKSGDAAAFGELSQMHYRALYNYATKFSSDPEFIRDCIQELYLELWERRTFLSETAFVKSYLLKALRHKLIKESVRLKRFKEPKELFFDADESDLSVESLIIQNEHLKHQIKRLNTIVSHLSKRQQEIIYLRFYQNLENEDISQIMNLGRQSVANLLYRTIKEIKEIWMPAEFFWGLLLIVLC